jgi:hypothetical protein
LEADSTLAWQGKFGEADLRIEVPASGRIFAEWTTPAGTRQKVVDSIEQLERSVLFQLMVGSGVGDEKREEVADAVALTLANRTPMPSPNTFQSRRPERKRPQRPRPGGHRRGGGRPGGGRPRRRR